MLTTIPSGHVVTKMQSGIRAVAAAATPEPLVDSNAYARAVLVQPASESQGACFLGTEGAEVIELPYIITAPVESQVINLREIFVKVATNGDSVKFLATY
jgi:hypothetical protein